MVSKTSYLLTSLLGDMINEELLVSQLVGALNQSSTKDYIRAEHKLQSVSNLFLPQVIIPQVFFSKITAQILSTISERKTRKTVAHVLEPIYIP